MFARSYFAGSYFAPAYFPPVVALVEVEVRRAGLGGYWDYWEPVERKAWVESQDDSDIQELIPIFLIVIEGDQ